MEKLQKSFKIYLMVCAICVAVIIPGVLYIYKMTEKDLPDMDVLRPHITQEAFEYAKNHSVKDCVNETMLKIKSCDIRDYTCRVSGKIFLKECLVNAKQISTFCDGFPQGQEDVKTGKWRVNICLDHKEIHNIVCTNTFEAAEEFCADKIKKK